MTKLTFAACLLTLVAATSPLFAQEEGGRQGGGQGGARRAPSPVKAQMEKVDEALETVGKFLEKPSGEAPMAAVTAAQVALQEAKQHEPRITQRQPEGERPAFVADYRIQINKTMRGLLDLEDAMVQKDWKAAEKAMATLKDMEKAGHDKFKPKRQRRGEGGEGGGREGGGGGREGGGDAKRSGGDV